MQINTGIAVSISFQSIFATCCIMKNPTTISAGAVAKDGIARKIGEKNSAIRKSTPTTIDVRPVLPPSAIPEADSPKVVIVEVPKIAPTVVPIASARRAPLIPGSFPSRSNISALEAHPINVPRVSKTSTKRKAKTTIANSRLASFDKSIFIKVGATDAGMETTFPGIRL